MTFTRTVPLRALGGVAASLCLAAGGRAEPPSDARALLIVTAYFSPFSPASQHELVLRDAKTVGGYRTFVVSPLEPGPFIEVHWADDIDAVPLVLGRVDARTALAASSRRINRFDLVDGSVAPLLPNASESLLLEIFDGGAYLLRPSSQKEPGSLYLWKSGEPSHPKAIDTSATVGRLLGVTPNGFWFRSFDLASVCCIDRNGRVLSSFPIDPLAVLKRRYCAFSPDGQLAAFGSPQMTSGGLRWTLSVVRSDTSQEIYRGVHLSDSWSPMGFFYVPKIGESLRRTRIAESSAVALAWLTPRLLACWPPPEGQEFPLLDFAEDSTMRPRSAELERWLPALAATDRSASEWILNDRFAVKENCLVFRADKSHAVCGLGDVAPQVSVAPSGEWAAVVSNSPIGAHKSDLVLVDGETRECRLLASATMVQVAWLPAQGASNDDLRFFIGTQLPVEIPLLSDEE